MTIRTAYLAAAIDQKVGGSDVFEFMKSKLGSVQCFNPRAAFAGDFDRTQPEVQDFICSINFNAMTKADVIIAYTDLKAVSFGMPMELMYAAYLGKPVILVVDSDKWAGVYATFFATTVIRPEQLTLDLVQAEVDFFNSRPIDTQPEERLRAFIRRIFPEGW